MKLEDVNPGDIYYCSIDGRYVKVEVVEMQQDGEFSVLILHNHRMRNHVHPSRLRSVREHDACISEVMGMKWRQ